MSSLEWVVNFLHNCLFYAYCFSAIAQIVYMLMISGEKRLWLG